MAKKQSMKQQIMQSIANSHVKQAMANIQKDNVQKLQAEFDAWNKQQDEIAALQAEYDAWNQANPVEVQQPVQQATVSDVKPKKIPSILDTPLSANAQAIADKAKAKREAEEAQKARKNLIDEEEWLRPKTASGKDINKAAAQEIFKNPENLIKEYARQQNVSVDEARRRYELGQKKQAITVRDDSKVDMVNNKVNTLKPYLDTDKKLTRADAIKARAAARKVLDSFDYRSGGVPVLDNEEDRQLYADAVNVMNKTSRLAQFSQGALNPFLKVARNVNNSVNVMGDQLQKGAATVSDALGLTGNAREKAQQDIEQRQKVLDSINASNQAAYENARKQNPALATLGEFAGMAGMYAMTNPLFDEAAAAIGGGSRLGQFAANQAGQNAQDMVLDTLPTLKDYMADGSLSDEEKKDLTQNVGLNVVGNLIPGLIGEGINSYKGAKAVENIAPDVDNVVRNATRQAEDAAQSIDNIARDYENLLGKQASNIYDSANYGFDDVNIPPKTVNAGKATYIDTPYKDGSVPNNIGTPDRVVIDAEAYNNANASLKEANNSGNFASRLKDMYRNFFDKKGQRTVVLDNVDFNDSDYVVSINKSSVNETINKGFLSPEKLAVMEDIDEVISKGEYVGSATPKYHGTKDKNNIIRYDYFETPISINGSNYICTYDVEVYKGSNNYKTHKVVNEINLVPVTEQGLNDVETTARIISNNGIAATPGPKPGAPTQPLERSLSNVNVADDIPNVNKDSVKFELPEDVQDKLLSDFEEIYSGLDAMDKAAQASGNPAAVEKFQRLQQAVFDYEQSVWKSESMEDINKAKKASDAARQAFIREMKKTDPNYKGTLTGTKLGNAEYRRKEMLKNADNAQATVDAINELEDLGKSNNVEGANPLQTFADGTPKEEWKTSKFRTNTAENQGWGDNLPEKDYAYRVESEAEQHEMKAERYKDSKDVAADLLAKDYDGFDEVDVKAAMDEIQSLMDQGDVKKANRLAKRLAYEGREGGRKVQAFAEYNRNTAAGALEDAAKVQEDSVLNPWKSRNKKKAEGNSRIARALSDMGNKWKGTKNATQLTHDQIKKGVIAELDREVGSVEKYFNDSDIEYLTQLAEDKSIPVWQITSEIEHKLKTGNWYTLDESLPIPQPTNKKLQNALNALVTEQIRTEKAAPSLKQIADEVRNTLAKESADFSGNFTDDDIDYLANLIHEGATKEELSDALNLKMATGSFGISDETLKQVNNIFKQISNYDVNSKQFVEGQAEAYRLLAEEIVPNATWMEKFEAWRYIAMLGNPKTMLRNFVGNQTFGAVTGISNNIAAVAEAGIDKGIKALGGEGIQRTKSVLNPIADGGLIKAASQDADASRYRQIIGSKYEKMDKDALRQSKSVFNSKLARFYEKVTDAGISDYHAVKNKYSTSLAGYLKANGYDSSIFDSEIELQRLRNLSETQLLSDAQRAKMESLSKDVTALEKARDYALKQAEYATFHEDNEVAKMLTKWSRDARNSDSKAANALGLLIEGTVPFKKTPANVLRSGIEYSPLGAIDSIKKTGKLIYENTGKRAGNLADTYINKKGKEVARTLASDVIDSWAKTLTGTGLTGLGFYLYNKGILHSSDPDTKYQDELEGHQNYAIEINGHSYTLDWAAPTIMPLMVGAEVAKLWSSTGKDDADFLNNIDDYVAAANRIADPLVETSMLSGVKDTLDTAANAAQYNENLNIPALIMYNTLTGYATQGIPTLAGQVARTIDPTRRSTYTDKEGVAGVLDKQLKKQMNKIPGLSMLNQPYVDTYGRTQQNSPFNNTAGNLAYQMLSPGYLSEINETDADRISRDAYSVGNNAGTLPKWQSNFKDAEGNRVSPEEYTKAATAYGESNYQIREALANDEWFNSLDNAEKEEVVKSINGISEHIGKSTVIPGYTTSSKAYNEYAKGGIPSLLDYYKQSQAKALAKESGLNSSTNASKEIQKDVESGNMEAAQQKIDAAQQLSDLGLNKPGPTYSYYNAQKQIPGLTVEDFAKTYKSIDSDGNQGIKQDEVIAYLNKNKITSASEANQIWSVYGNSEWKSIPSLKDGKWTKKKK